MSDNISAFRDAFNLLCDDKIGYGASREVYSSRVLPDCVIKVETGIGKFQNILEWETWDRVSQTEFAKWFAPCEWISPNGVILIMKKTLPAHKYPDKIPAFFTDTKRTNFGVYKGNFVCHDYGMHLLMENGMTKRMRKADWWDE